MDCRTPESVRQTKIFKMKTQVLSEKVKSLLAQLTAATDHVTRAKLIADLEERNVKPSVIQIQGSIADYELRHYRRVNTKLITEVYSFFSLGKISFSLAKVLASAPQEKQEDLAREAIAKRLSVSTLRNKITGNHSAKFLRDMERLSDRYSEETGFDIRIIPDPKNSKAGHWVISYHNLDMFDAITEKLVGMESDF